MMKCLNLTDNIHHNPYNIVSGGIVVDTLAIAREIRAKEEVITERRERAINKGLPLWFIGGE